MINRRIVRYPFFRCGISIIDRAAGLCTLLQRLTTKCLVSTGCEQFYLGHLD